MINSKAIPLSPQDIDALNTGTWILGTGGGGDPYYVYLNAQTLAKQGKQATIIDPMLLDDDALIAMVAYVGAPLASQERIDDYQFAIKPVTVMREHLGREFDALIPLEIGGANGMHAVPISMAMGIPIVDADAMGRAYPELQMITLAVDGMPVPPMCISDIRNNDVVLPKLESWTWGERIIRVACAEMGAIATFCLAMTGKQVKQHTISNTISTAITIGNSVITANKNNENPITAMLANTNGKLLFSGKVADVERRIADGFVKGKMAIKGIGEQADDTVVIHFQNEFSVAELNGKTLVTTPDLICVVDTETGAGVGTDTIRYGQRLSVVALPTSPIYLSPTGLQATSPRAFGFDIDYKTVF